eukprot:gnl/MRDRNA2_/MRDRNA2_87228_c0_seq1.p1 gnl/MRDRNA2_/MRDRNA2_87228_c0~~gnl/MRDRNA2_/MRDRNA2_87228_c0_seq1.p1  ORF type:complete len:221 (-),score=35.77 gnl/MRDRNA2_/MRDRNA2_87228_c0_seq1:773-1435(-)
MAMGSAPAWAASMEKQISDLKEGEVPDLYVTGAGNVEIHGVYKFVGHRKYHSKPSSRHETKPEFTPEYYETSSKYGLYHNGQNYYQAPPGQHTSLLPSEEGWMAFPEFYPEAKAPAPKVVLAPPILVLSMYASMDGNENVVIQFRDMNGEKRAELKMHLNNDHALGLHFKLLTELGVNPAALQLRLVVPDGSMLGASDYSDNVTIAQVLQRKSSVISGLS